jgi:hypothetical protein
MRLLGIQRSPIYSPGRHQDNDRLIFDATVEALRRRGCAVATMTEDEVGGPWPDAQAVFSMCQGDEANSSLLEREGIGVLVINSPRAVKNCHRARLHHLLGRDRGSFAPAELVPTCGGGRIPPSLHTAGGCWLKRGDVHATAPGDVVHVRGEADYLAALRQLCARGIPVALAVPHVEGEVVKFYGVLGSPFFRFYCERNPGHVPAAFAAACVEVEVLVRRVGLEIYGGDAVITPEGRVVVIDLNDWPSFAPFRDEASHAIACHIFHRAVALTGRQDRIDKVTRVVAEVDSATSAEHSSQSVAHAMS